MRALLSSCVLLALLLLPAGCTSDPGPVGTITSAAPVTPAAPSAEDRVDDPDARLAGVRVTRSGRALTVSAVWALPDGPRPRWVLARGRDGFATATYVAGGFSRLMRKVAGPERTQLRESAGEVLGRLLPYPTISLAPGIDAVVAGGDGATLLPFEKVARSTDGGAHWRVATLPRFDGEMAYTSGAVVTADGRLLALLDHFSDDRRNDPGPRDHGLWVSEDGDWSSYRPLSPRMVPEPEPSPGGWGTVVSLDASRAPDPLIWLTTWDHRLYVSTDGGASFREIPAR